MRAYGKYILVKPFKRPNRKPSGEKYTAAEIEELGRYFPGSGRVLSVGQLVADIKKGNVIYFKKHHEEIHAESEKGELWLIPLEAMLGVEEKK